MKSTIKKLFLSCCTFFLFCNLTFALADSISDTEKLFNWAENSFPQYFSSREVTQSSDPWMFRFYPETGVYAGVNTNDNGVYVFGGPWGNLNPVYIDNLYNLLMLVQNGEGKLTDIIAIYNDKLLNQSRFALNSNGTVVAWGANFSGQLGDGTTINRTIPVQVKGLNDVVDIVSLTSVTYALKKDGTVWVWGSGAYGEFGDGNKTINFSPTKIVSLTDITKIGYYRENIDLSNHYGLYAIKNDGTVWAWGLLANSLLNSFSRDLLFPTQVSHLSDVVDFRVVGDTNNRFILKKDGTVWAWGSNKFGQLGDGTTLDSEIPKQIQGLNDIVKIVVNYGARPDRVGYEIYVHALKKDGTVWAWGSNKFGQLGDGTTLDRLFPIQIEGLSNIIDLADEDSYAADSVRNINHSLALNSDGTVWAWGYNNYGQLGDGTTTNRLKPIQVAGLNNIIKIRIFDGFSSFAFSNDGFVYGWGNNALNNLGKINAGIIVTTPSLLLEISNVLDMKSSSLNKTVLKHDGTVWTFGANVSGELGDGSPVGTVGTTSLRQVLAP